FVVECVEEDLPVGFSIQVSADETTCEIIGLPVEVQTATTFTVTATNIMGSATADITIETLQETPFITTWKTDNPGTSEDDQITILTSPDFEYNFRVDWGDGNIDENVTGNITHTYAVPGEYVVSITGTYPQPFFEATTDEAQTDSLKL